MKPFESFLAPQLEQYLAYRKSHGFKMETTRYQLRTFDQYLKEKKTVPEILQPSFFLELQADLKTKKTTINGIIYALRVFFQFLVRIEYYTENPLQDIPNMKTNTFIPFVFSPEQTDQLLAAISKRIRKTQEYFLKDLGCYMAVMLSARCGLRISEPLRLHCHHYRPDEKTLYIKNTKFRKDRLIPIPVSAANEIDNYLSLRRSLLPNTPNPYLFVRDNHKGLSYPRIWMLFHKAINDTGLNQSQKSIGRTDFSAPTLHSFRHSFAINTLKRIKARGKSSQDALPILAVYMGHSSYKNTIYYLKMLDADQRQKLFSFAVHHKS